MATAGATETGFHSSAPKLGFIGGFDGIRGIGILAVLANHAYSDLSPSFAGFIDIFFVMSAFLIVSLLMQEYRENDRLDFRKFYARRGIRLLPSAYLCILAWLVFSLLFERERVVWVLQDAAAAVTYVYQLVFPVGLAAVDPVAASERSIDHFWSLAVEEQFYLFIGVIVLVALVKRWMVPLAALMAAMAIYIGWQRWTGHTGPWNGGVPTNSSIPARGFSLLWMSRPDSLMWGVVLAVINAYLPDPLPAAVRRWLPRAGMVGLVVAAVTIWLSSPYLYQQFSSRGIWFPFFPMAPVDGVTDGYTGRYWIQFGHTLTALGFSVALIAMARAKDWGANRALSWKPARSLGRQSYTLYVWHTFFYWVLLDLLGLDAVLGEKTRVFVMIPITILACYPIFRYVEQPLLKAKLRFASEKEVLDLRTGTMTTTDPGAADPAPADAAPADRAAADPAPADAAPTDPDTSTGPVPEGTGPDVTSDDRPPALS